ncbi:hypothetical protein IV203_028105 [Nitzschia inconspicua]|uniref:Uncharacterized protein n=1 Tax=Nitzschia inconspicua TaxID=303405 RepID=A0A9K3LY87_9STRA|nr:hypothetical protein IV203_028105 [Nitzschia inconspicua]
MEGRGRQRHTICVRSEIVLIVPSYALFGTMQLFCGGDALSTNEEVTVTSNGVDKIVALEITWMIWLLDQRIPLFAKEWKLLVAKRAMGMPISTDSNARATHPSQLCHQRNCQ